MNDDPITDDELAELVGRTAEAAAAYMRGDMDTYLGLIHHAPGFTLLRPTGGPPDRFEDRAEGVRASAGFFADGDARLEQVEAHVWGDTVVLAMIERQHGRVGGMPDQDCSLRVTLVYRRDGSGWRLVHRHADPLVDVSRSSGWQRSPAAMSLLTDPLPVVEIARDDGVTCQSVQRVPAATNRRRSARIVGSVSGAGVSRY